MENLVNLQFKKSHVHKKHTLISPEKGMCLEKMFQLQEKSQTANVSYFQHI